MFIEIKCTQNQMHLTNIQFIFDMKTPQKEEDK